MAKLKDYMYKRAAMSNGPGPKPTAKPIVTDDPKDSRLKMYNDSLSLYERGQKHNARYENFIKKNKIPRTAISLHENPDVGDRRNDINPKIKPLRAKTFWTTYSDGKPGVISDTKIPIKNVPDSVGRSVFLYKKPVQPVVLKKASTPKSIQKDTVASKPVAKPIVKDTTPSKPSQKIPKIKSSNNYGDTGTVNRGSYIETKTKMTPKKGPSQFKTVKKNYK